jgi:hypothetical protein
MNITDLFQNPIVLAILSGVLGMPLSALIEMVKRGLIKYIKMDPDWKLLGYVSGAVTILAVAAIVMVPLHAFTIPLWLLYSFIAWISANGFYKEVAKVPQGK